MLDSDLKVAIASGHWIMGCMDSYQRKVYLDAISEGYDISTKKIPDNEHRVGACPCGAVHKWTPPEWKHTV